jgi:tRNA(Ile)-lysidine synthase
VETALPQDLADRLRAAGRALPLDPALVAALAAEPAVAVAVSGGADSVALLAALAAEPALLPRLAVLHYDHAARGEASAADAAFVRALAGSLGMPFDLGRRAAAGPASETALREARHAWLAAAMAARGIRSLCLGHHADDRAETLLLRLARGAGPEGLAAPRAEQAFRDGTRRVRPLLRHRRSTLRAALAAAGVPWREDATNALPGAPRNRLRLAALPALGEALGAGWHEGLGRASDNLAEAADALRAWLAELGGLPDADGVSRLAALRGRPRALVRLACAEAAWAAGVDELGGPAFEQLVDAVHAGRRTRLSLGGLDWAWDGETLRVPRAAPGWGAEERALVADGAPSACGLAAERRDLDAATWDQLSRGAIPPVREVWLRLPAGARLGWRSRLPGDAYRPLGAPGVAKLSDLLIDRKVPRERREGLPVVLVDSAPAWVPGVPPAESLRLSGPTKGALRLTWQPPRLA